MKKLILVSALFSGSMASADWLCEAYCATGDGYKLVSMHDNHPADALMKITTYCKENFDRDSNRIYIEVGNRPWPQANVENACRQIDTVCK